MKLIIAYIPNEQQRRVINALTDHHVHGLTIMEAHGFGQEHDSQHPEHRDFHGLEMTKKLRLEIACHDEEVEAILQAIYSVGHTGHRGDGKVLVLPLLDALRLRTGDRGASALGTPIQ